MAAVWLLRNYLPSESVAWKLAATVALGAVTYLLALMALWIAMGRPDSIEAIVIEKFAPARLKQALKIR